MGSAIDKLIGKPTAPTKTGGAVKSGSAIDRLLKGSPAPAKNIPPKDAATHLFNPLNPNNIINKPFPKTNPIVDILGNVAHGLKTVAYQVPGAIKDTFQIPTSIVKSVVAPSETSKGVEKKIYKVPHAPYLIPAKVISRVVEGFVEGYGAQVADILFSNEQSKKLIDEKPVVIGPGKKTYLVGGAVQPSFIQQETRPPNAEDILNTIVNATSVAGLLAPIFSGAATRGTLKIYDAISKNSRVPLSYSDVQKITTAGLDPYGIKKGSAADGYSGVGIEKYKAYQEAAAKDTVRASIKQGYVEIAQKDPAAITKFQNVLKNIATRPVKEILNFGKEYGRSVKTTTPPLLEERNTGFPESNPMPPEVKASGAEMTVMPTAEEIKSPPVMIVPETGINKPTITPTPISKPVSTPTLTINPKGFPTATPIPTTEPTPTKPTVSPTSEPGMESITPEQITKAPVPAALDIIISSDTKDLTPEQIQAVEAKLADASPGVKSVIEDLKKQSEVTQPEDAVIKQEISDFNDLIDVGGEEGVAPTEDADLGESVDTQINLVQQEIARLTEKMKGGTTEIRKIQMEGLKEKLKDLEKLKDKLANPEDLSHQPLYVTDSIIHYQAPDFTDEQIRLLTNIQIRGMVDTGEINNFSPRQADVLVDAMDTRLERIRERIRTLSQEIQGSQNIQQSDLKSKTSKLKAFNRALADTQKVVHDLQNPPEQLARTEAEEPLGFDIKNLVDPNAPKAKVELGKVRKRSEIADWLSRKLNVPIRRGKFNAKGALGIFKTKPKVVRIKKGGTPTIFHEVAHYLDGEFNFSKDIELYKRPVKIQLQSETKGTKSESIKRRLPSEGEKLLMEYGNARGGVNVLKQEAFAEFVRYRMTRQQAKTDVMAPKFSKIYDKRMASLPEIKDVLDTVVRAYARWEDQPATAKVLSHISVGPPTLWQRAQKITWKSFSNKIHNFYSKAKDEFHPISRFSSLGKKQGLKIEAQNDPYKLVRNLKGSIPGKAEVFLEKGTFGKDYWKMENGKAQPVYKGKSYHEIMNPVFKAGLRDDFTAYIVDQRIIEDLAPRNIESGIELSVAKKSFEELSAAHPEFKKIAADRIKFKTELLEYAKETGLMGQDTFDRIMTLNPNHVPFYRVMEEIEIGLTGSKKTGSSSPIKRIKGSEREIIDPLESDVKDVYAIINAAERNNLRITMANLAKQLPDLGRLVEQVDRPLRPIKVSVREVMNKATYHGAETIDQELVDLMVTVFRAGIDEGPNMMTVNMGDKILQFQVEPELFKSLQGLDNEDLSVFVKILSIPAKLLRAGATLSPGFSLRNPFRDVQTAALYSNYGFKPTDFFRGIIEIFKSKRQGDIYNSWKMGGGEHSTLVSTDRPAVQKKLDELFAAKGQKAIDSLNIIKDPWVWLKTGLKGLQWISEIGERASRVGEMRRAINASANPIQAAYDSREVTLDFARIGSKTKSINAVDAFFNAKVEGVDRMIRAIKDNPVRTLFRAFVYITLPAILLYYHNRKDPRWAEIPAWQKSGFWIFIVPNGPILRFPKSPETGVLFGSVPEGILDWLDTRDPHVFKEMERSVLNGLNPGIWPTAMLPIWEWYSNYSNFLDRPIVPRGKENYPPEAQTGTYTSETAKIIGETLHQSPAKIDNLIQGYTGGLGAYTTSTLDKILTGTGIRVAPEKPEINIEDFPLIKSFMIRPPVGTGSESVNRFYNEAAVIVGSYAYVRQLVESGQIDKAKEYAVKHPDIKNVKLVNTVSADFTKMNQARDAIRNSMTLTGKEKQEKIQQIDEAQTKIAKIIVEQLRNNN